MTERSSAAFGLVAQQEVGEDEPGCGGSEGQDADDTDGHGHPREGEGDRREVGDEESGDGAEELVEGVAFGGAFDQLELAAQPCRGVLSDGPDDPPRDRPDAVDGRVRCWRGGTDRCSWAGQVGQDEPDRGGPRGERTPCDQRAGADSRAEEAHDDDLHGSTPTAVGLAARAVKRSGRSMRAMRVRSHPPVAKMAPTTARTS